MEWNFTMGTSLSDDDRREILKKHYVKKEPFGKILIHEIHVPELVEHFLSSSFEIKINCNKKEIVINSAE